MSKLLCKSRCVFQERKARRRLYCLHCEELYSRSGMHCHRLTITHPPSVIQALEKSFFEKLRLHEVKVMKLLEKKGVVWLKGTALIQTPRICPFALQPQRMEHAPPPRPPRPNQSPRVVHHLEGEHVVLESVVFSHDHPVEEIEEDVQNNFPDLLGCFSNEGFDQKRFIDFTEDFFNEFPETMDKKNSTRCKAKRRR